MVKKFVYTENVRNLMAIRKNGGCIYPSHMGWVEDGIVYKAQVRVKEVRNNPITKKIDIVLPDKTTISVKRIED